MKVHTVYGSSHTYDAVLTCILLHTNGYTYHSNILITIQVTFHPIYHISQITFGYIDRLG